MIPVTYLKKLAAKVSDRCGICRATVEIVLPAFIDEVRYQLCEGKYPCIPIESFGTFAVINRPEHEYLFNRGGANRICIVPARRQLKFNPTNNMKREVEAARFDPTRKAFSRHPDDPLIRKRNQMVYRKGKFYNREEGGWGKPIYKHKDQPAADTAETTNYTNSSNGHTESSR